MNVPRESERELSTEHSEKKVPKKLIGLYQSFRIAALSLVLQGCAVRPVAFVSRMDSPEIRMNEVLPVRIRGPFVLPNETYHEHRHLFPRSVVGRMESFRVVHLPMPAEAQFLYLFYRKEFLIDLLRQFRQHMSKEDQIRFELEIRFILDEMPRIHRRERRARQKAREALEEV